MSDLDKAVRSLRRLKKPQAMTKVYVKYGPEIFRQARDIVEFDRYMTHSTGDTVLAQHKTLPYRNTNKETK
jgi:hypothetical protein